METDALLQLEYLARQYDETNIPLYLSYPTTSWWKTTADQSDLAKAYNKDETPFLYFHFPYCKKACYYCCCYKRVTTDESDKDKYIAYLAKEIRLKLAALQTCRLGKVHHMHWGGGTPTYLTCAQIERIFASIAQYADIAAEPDSGISIESYPDDTMITREKLKLLRSLGFNEISFGIQDFDERIQKVINRDSNPQTVYKISSQARELGFRIHIDLCYGLPFQGLNELEKTIKHIAAVDPDRIAVFPYVHYPLSFPLQKKIPGAGLPNSFMKILLIRHASSLFGELGYQKVGIDHYVKPGNPLYTAASAKRMIKDFMGYSVQERKAFLGFGHAAISFLGRRYFHNCLSLEEYYRSLDRDELPLEKSMSHVLSADDVIRNAVIQKGILCDFTIDKERIGAEFNIDFDAYFAAELHKLGDYAANGLVEAVSANEINITRQGQYVARHIAHLFDGYYKHYEQGRS